MLLCSCTCRLLLQLLLLPLRVAVISRCILDHQPRQFSAENTTLLAQLANMVMREVERKRAMNDALCNAAVRQTRYVEARGLQFSVRQHTCIPAVNKHLPATQGPTISKDT